VVTEPRGRGRSAATRAGWLLSFIPGAYLLASYLFFWDGENGFRRALAITIGAVILVAPVVLRSLRAPTLSSATAHLQVNGACGYISVRRAPAYRVDRLRTFRLLVDGVMRASLAPDGVVVIEVGPGGHTLQARIDWSGSQKSRLFVQPGETRSFVVSSPGVYSGLLRSFSTQRYLRLYELQ
jgi:hypothetical protein